jgi:hypothetical protein
MEIKRRPGRYEEQPTERTCKTCTATKPINEFQPQNVKRNGGRPTYRHSCRECERKEALNRYHARQATGNCSRCGKRRTDGGLNTCRSCRDKNSQSQDSSIDKLRATVLLAYGKKCSHCGDPRIQCLEFDHVGGWGNTHRKKSGGKLNGYCLWVWIRDNGFPNSVRLLCGSCHSALSYWGFLPKQLPAFDFDVKLRQAPISNV